LQATGYLFAFVAVPASTKSAGFEQLPSLSDTFRGASIQLLGEDFHLLACLFSEPLVEYMWKQ
jgi:hypothetical protein